MDDLHKDSSQTIMIQQLEAEKEEVSGYLFNRSIAEDVRKIMPFNPNSDSGKRTPSKLADPFLGKYGVTGFNDLIEPPFNPRILSSLFESSNILKQCSEAMETNIDGFGYEFLEIVDSEHKEGLEDDIKLEKKRLEQFFKYISIEDDFIRLRKKIRRDLEITGNAYLEVILNNKGEFIGLEWVPSIFMRMTRKEKKFKEYKLYKRDDIDYTIKEEIVDKRFRKFAQTLEGIDTESALVWFKEFGDNRFMDARNGKYVSENEVKAEETNVIEASSIIHLKLHANDSEYGKPRWIGNLLSVLGSRNAEEVNMLYFDNGCILDIAILVSGGTIGDKTVQRIKEFVTQAKGKSNAHRVLVLESIASKSSKYMDSMQNRTSIDIKELNSREDSLFSNYLMENTDKIRSSYRVAPLFVGISKDYNMATAEASKEVTEEQVFEPERQDFDYFVNRNLMPLVGSRFHDFHSLGERRAKVQEVSEIIKEFKSVMTVREGRRLLDQVTDIKLDEIEDEEILSTIIVPINQKEEIEESSEEITEEEFEMRSKDMDIDIDKLATSVINLRNLMRKKVEQGSEKQEIN